MNNFIVELLKIDLNFVKVFIETIVFFITIVGIIRFVFYDFNKTTKKLSQAQINKFKNNGKYIKGLFIELNKTKEVLRFFIYGEKWKKKIVKQFNSIYHNYYGNLIKENIEDYSLLFKLNSFSKSNRVNFRFFSTNSITCVVWSFVVRVMESI